MSNASPASCNRFNVLLLHPRSKTENTVPFSLFQNMQARVGAYIKCKTRKIIDFPRFACGGPEGSNRRPPRCKRGALPSGPQSGPFFLSIKLISPFSSAEELGLELMVNTSLTSALQTISSFHYTT